MEIVTADLSKFGNREIQESINLLKEYLNNPLNCLSDGLTLNFNCNSGNVFLSDEDYNVGMLNNGVLEEFYNCSECGKEGFKEDFDKEVNCEYCKEIANK